MHSRVSTMSLKKLLRSILVPPRSQSRSLSRLKPSQMRAILKLTIQRVWLPRSIKLKMVRHPFKWNCKNLRRNRIKRKLRNHVRITRQVSVIDITVINSLIWWTRIFNLSEKFLMRVSMKTRILARMKACLTTKLVVIIQSTLVRYCLIDTLSFRNLDGDISQLFGLQRISNSIATLP